MLTRPMHDETVSPPQGHSTAEKQAFLTWTMVFHKSALDRSNHSILSKLILVTQHEKVSETHKY